MSQLNDATLSAPTYQIIQRNCDISDARDNGIYTICTLFLKFRNLYKWEKNIEPWCEPESSDLLDWISEKETFWHAIGEEPFSQIHINGRDIDPFHVEQVNAYLSSSNLIYGAGYGRSMKAIFFLGEKMEEKTEEGCQVIILGHELSRELAAPFAMRQEGVIYVRREPLRYFFWDQIMEIRPSGKDALHYALHCYNLINDAGRIDYALLRDNLDSIVNDEMAAVIYHEIGEALDDSIERSTFEKTIAAFPSSPIELLVRALKDILEDTNPRGMVGHILAEKKKTSLGFYVTFLSGLHKVLFPEMSEAFRKFSMHGDWEEIERATSACRKNNLVRADKLNAICKRLEIDSSDRIRLIIQQELLAPLGL